MKSCCRGSWLVVGIFVLALALRVGAIGYLSKYALASFAENRSIALSMSVGQGFSLSEFRYLGPTSQKPPVYPMLLSVAYRVFGSDQHLAHFVMLGLNAVLGAVSALLLMRIIRQITARHDIALLGGFIFAIWPTQIHAATYLQGLTLSCTLLLSAIALWQIAPLKPNTWRWIVAGLLLGIMALTESTLTLFAIGLVALTFVRRPRGAIFMLVACAIVVAPWINRNCIVQGRATGITNSLAIDLWKGNHDRATGSEHLGVAANGLSSKSYEALTPEQSAMLRGQPERKRVARLMEWAQEWITAHPSTYFQLSLTRAAKTLWTDWHHPLSRKALNLGCRSVGLLALLIAFALKSRRRLTLPLLLAGSLVLATAFTMASARNGVFLDLCEIPALAGLMLPRKSITPAN